MEELNEQNEENENQKEQLQEQILDNIQLTEKVKQLDQKFEDFLSINSSLFHRVAELKTENKQIQNELKICNQILVDQELNQKTLIGYSFKQNEFNKSMESKIQNLESTNAQNTEDIQKLNRKIEQNTEEIQQIKSEFHEFQESFKHILELKYKRN